MLDRRQGDRRQNDEGPDGLERRRGDLRRNEETERVLRTRGFVMVPEP